ncbi:dockerin type I domain-containing protein [Posidoniimonas polymericola]|nr:dockerin type I domain-containing protein [Posidoniimonas polymericola]
MYEIGQTFTVGAAGLLTRVDVGVGKVGTPVGDLLLDIRRLHQNVPSDEPPLFQTVIPKTSLPQRAANGLTAVTAIDVSAGRITVTPGDRLAIVLSSDQDFSQTNTIVWDRGNPGYANGAAGERIHTAAWTLDNTYDFGFRSWVDPAADLPGDFNDDQLVDADDYQAWKMNYGSTTQLAADANGDNVVDAADYTIWRDNQTTPASSPGSQSIVGVPAPAGAVLVGWLLPAASLMRRRIG